MLLTSFVAALVAGTVPQPTSCTPIAGSRSVMATRVQWLIVGEPHGTNEVPEAFGDLVCLISRQRRVTVAVEQPISEQVAIDAFTSSDGGAEARTAFLRSAIWTNGFKDGRSSRAMFRLFERLREFRIEGRIDRVVAFQPTDVSGAGVFERAMADVLLREARKHDLIIALVGSVHAQINAVSFGGPAYLPMAALLPRNSTITLDARPTGGEQWACMSMTECGPLKITTVGQPHRRLLINAAAYSPYNGVFDVGVAATTSQPQ